MALFVNKPQFDDELPGLPGEPLRPESTAERLPAAVSSADALGLNTTSIAIPLTSADEVIAALEDASE